VPDGEYSTLGVQMMDIIAIGKLWKEALSQAPVGPTK